LKKTWSSPYRKPVRNLVLVLGLGLLGMLLPRHVGISETRSLEHTVFLLGYHHPREIERGEYLQFGLKGDPHVGDRVLIKRVVGVPGDEVETTADGRYLVNGVLVAVAKPYSLEGERLTWFRFRGQIPAGRYFVCGEHKDSYDSRYFGLVDARDVVSMAYPVF
jgi:signal peptidase I